MANSLATYQTKRDFKRTPEPRGAIAAQGDERRFVVQKHAARRLHYDFRLELGGTLKSWAVPKGPSLDPADKRLAVHVEDHPLDYIDFEGDIPAHQYGAGHVEVWDTGAWEPIGDPEAGYKAGRLRFTLDGEKLQGAWKLVRTGMRGSADKEQWLLIKEKDDEARRSAEYDVTRALPGSVLSGTPRKAKSKARAKTANGSKTRKPAASGHKAPLPAMLKPQLATLVDSIPTTGDWLYEIKYDGYRILAKVEDGKARLFTRDGNDWTARLKPQTQAIEALGLRDAWLDGEIVVLDAQGVPSFQLLQKAFDNAGTHIHFFLFDLPYLNGHDLRKLPLRERRQALQQLLAGHESEVLRYSEELDQPPQQLLDSACALGLEGLIGKRTDSPYISARSDSWIKLKCRQRQEMVIAGYTEPRGSREYFGSLLLAYHDDDGKLHYAGRVGTGFDRDTLASVHRKMKPLEQKDCPFERRPKGTPADTHWLRPRLVAEVSFTEWTRGGALRQPVFHGLRSDKAAAQVGRERAKSPPARRVAARSGDSMLEGVKITHPERVIDPTSGATKLYLARYCQQVAPLILPYLANRPVYLLRLPEGIEGERFFQKHNTQRTIPGVRTLEVQLLSGRAPLMAIESAEALVGVAQMGTIELHVPNVTADRIDRPDCMVFDLDPDPDLPWSTMLEAAHLTHAVLDELGLCSFVKTSGGKGLHLVVPLTRRHDWDTVNDFSQAVAQHMARVLPQHFSAKMGAQNRVGKIFIDYLRNGRSASTIAPYSARARPGLPVSVPVAWSELDDIKSAAQWTIRQLPELLARAKNDPWAEFFESRQTITAAMKRKIGMK